MTTALSVRLPDGLSQQLSLLAEASSRTKSFCVTEITTPRICSHTRLKRLSSCAASSAWCHAVAMIFSMIF